MRKITSDASKKQSERQRKRRAKRKAAGLCVDCGKVRAHGVSPTKGRPYMTCEFCREKSALRQAEHTERKKAKDAKHDESKPVQCHPFTETGKRYRVKKTGKVGRIMPCPCPDPIILDIKDKGGGWSVLHLRDCQEVKPAAPISNEYLYAIVPMLQYLKSIYSRKEVL